MRFSAGSGEAAARMPPVRVHPVHQPIPSSRPARVRMRPRRDAARVHFSLRTTGRRASRTQISVVCVRVSPQIAYAILIRYANCVCQNRPPATAASSLLRTNGPNRDFPLRIGEGPGVSFLWAGGEVRSGAAWAPLQSAGQGMHCPCTPRRMERRRGEVSMGARGGAVRPCA